MSNKVGLVINEIKFWRTEWEGKFLSSFCLPLMLASEFGDVSDSINSPCNITQFPVCVFPSSPWECKLRKSRNFASFTAVFLSPRTVPGLQWVFVDKWTNVYSQKGTFPICFFFFWPHLWPWEVPRPGTEPAPQQWQCWTLNPLSHQRAPSMFHILGKF